MIANNSYISALLAFVTCKSLIFDNGFLPSPVLVYHGLINYKDTKTKWRHLKN